MCAAGIMLYDVILPTVIAGVPDRPVALPARVPEKFVDVRVFVFGLYCRSVSVLTFSFPVLESTIQRKC